MIRKAIFLINKTIIRAFGFESQVFFIRFLNPFCIVYGNRTHTIQSRRGIELIQTCPLPLVFMRTDFFSINRIPIIDTPKFFSLPF